MGIILCHPEMSLVNYRRNLGLVGTKFGAAAYMAKRSGSALGKYIRKKRASAKQTTPSNNGTVSDAPTTYQHDTRSLYSRRRAPKRVRIRARRQAQQFQKNMSSLLGGKFYIDNLFINTGVNVNQQGTFATTLMDVAQMGKIFNLFSVDGTVSTGSNYDFTINSAVPPTELMIKNIRQEVELKNVGTSLAYIDLYYFTPRKDTSLDPQSAISNLFIQSTATNGQITSTGTISALQTSTLGVTPFHSATFTENFLIYKVRRVMLQPSQSFSYMTRCRTAGNQSNRDWSGLNMRRNISSGVIGFAQCDVNNNGTGTNSTNISIHSQIFASCYKLGGKGTVSQSYAYTGQ